tara:strand:- start:43 stop:1467 length:1425 start_codon:yes stop_codon:yes gene_type:complete
MKATSMVAIIASSFIISFGGIEYITRKLHNPTSKTLTRINAAAGSVHLILAIFMYFYRPPLVEGVNIDFRDKNNDIQYGEIIEVKDDGYTVDVRENGAETILLDPETDIKTHSFKASPFQPDPILSIGMKIVYYTAKKEPTAGDEIPAFYAIATIKEIAEKYTITISDGSSIEIEKDRIALDCILQSGKSGKLSVNTKGDAIVFTSSKVTYEVGKSKVIAGGWRLKVFQKANNFDKGVSINGFANPKRINILGNRWKLTDSTALFSLLTAIAHFGLVASDFTDSKTYQTNMKEHHNPVRWIEYFVTSGIMMVNLGNVSGLVSANEVLAIFGLTAITNLFGMAIEETPWKHFKWIFMVSGFIPFAIPWYMISYEYFRIYDFSTQWLETLDSNNTAVKKIQDDLDKNLQIIGIFIVVIASLYNVFPAIQSAQINNPKKYILGESMFICASLLSKVALNIGVYSLSGRPNASFTEEN